MRHDTDNGLLHNSVCSIFIELTKLKNILKKPVELMTDMERISVFLRYARNPRYREIVNSVIASKEELAMAGELLMSISKDEYERAAFRNRRIAKADQESNRITLIRRVTKSVDEKWEGVVAGKDAEIADKDAQIERLRAMLNGKQFLKP